jgi:hypothetical protein
MLREIVSHSNNNQWFHGLYVILERAGGNLSSIYRICSEVAGI